MESDHRMAYFKAKLQADEQNTVTYKYRHFTSKGAAISQAWIAAHDFGDVYAERDVNEQFSVFLNT